MNQYEKYTNSKKIINSEELKSMDFEVYADRN